MAVQTVYAAFRSKRAVLESLLDSLDDEAGLEELGRALSTRGPREQAEAVARFLTRLFTRGADIIGAARSAGSDPALRTLARKGVARHRDGMKRVAAGWARAGALRTHMTEADAVAILIAITSYEVFQHLRSSGWTLKRYQQWLAVAIGALVLDDGKSRE